MAYLLDIAFANLMVAGLVALLAALAGLWGRRPALTHALWLLVLLKLITPPLFECSLPWPVPSEPLAQLKLIVDAKEPLPEPNEPMRPPLEDQWPAIEVLPPDADDVQPVEPPVELIAAVPVAVPEMVVEATLPWTWLDLMAMIWLAGSSVWLGLALRRLWRFQRLLRFAQPAPIHVQELARELADCLRVRCPDVEVLPGNVSPMLWALGRTPRLLLPVGLLARLSKDQLTTLLAHELAHWRRRDDRVRWLEFAVLALYWWCPLVWWARRELHQAEEECCDAWVVSILPDSAKQYALALVETVDFLSCAPALPPLASGLGRVRLLKRRLKMILNGKTPRSLTFTGLASVAGIGLLVLPLVWSRAQGPARPEPLPVEERNEPNRGGGGGAALGDRVELNRDDVRQLQREIQQRQEELQRRMAELQNMVQRLQQIERRRDGGAGNTPSRPEQNNQGGAGGGGRPGGGGPPGGAGGGWNPMGGPGGMPGGGQPGGNLDKRLGDVERKLDTLLQELRGMRGDMRPGTRPPGAKLPPGPGGRPVDPSTTPQPRGGAAEPSLENPLPGGGTPAPETRPIPLTEKIASPRD